MSSGPRGRAAADVIEPFVSFGSHGEDAVVWRALGTDGHVGTYVEVGATTVSLGSPTRGLYGRGWRGLVVVAAPELAALVAHERPGDTCALTSPDDASRVAALVADAGRGRPDLLVVGAAVAPDRRAPLVAALVARGRPARVCVLAATPAEVVDSAGRTADPAVDLLVAHGYTHCLFDGAHHFLTDEDALVAPLTLPALPGDVRTAALEVLQAERDALHVSLAALRTEVEALRTALTRAMGGAATDPATWVSGGAEGSAAVPLPRSEPDGFGGSGVGDAGLAPTDDDHPDPTAHEETPARVHAEPLVRAGRRRATMRRLLHGRRGPRQEVTSSRLERLVRLEADRAEPDDVVIALFRAVLGREPEPDGLRSWAARVRGGDPLLVLALDMAASDEARSKSPAERDALLADLGAWGTLLAAHALGLTYDPARHRVPGADLAARIFVVALFQVAHARAPEPGELEHEVCQLARGVGREWLLRDFAARPEVVTRYLGVSRPGARAKLRRWRDRRALLPAFRAEVLAAESRRLATIQGSADALPPDARDHGAEWIAGVVS